LASLPATYGFDSVASFIAAVEASTGRRAYRKRGRPAKGASAPKQRRGKRARITDEIRAQVKKLVEAGTTGKEIGKTLGISMPSVQNIKKALWIGEGTELKHPFIAISEGPTKASYPP